ncbi:MAG: PEGA domain-containing protein [Myxococcales bacterium]|nr:PEGA domain-containing protein [Myxococcales bacterium]
MGRPVSKQRRAITALATLMCVAGMASMARGAPAKLRVTLYSTWSKTDVPMQSVLDALAAELEANIKLDYTAVEGLVRDPGIKAARAALAAAQKKVALGDNKMQQLEVQAAVKLLEEAANTERRHFAVLTRSIAGAKQHARTLGKLAMAYFLAGDQTKCREALVKGFVVDKKLDYDTKRFPPAMKRVFDEAKFLLHELGTGKVRIETKPRGAQLRVAGRLLGRAPLVTTLPASFNLITARRVGYRAATELVAVPGGSKVPTVTIKLKPLPGAPGALLEKAAGEARAQQPGPALRQLGLALGQQVLIFATLVPSRPAVAIELAAYRVKDSRVVATVKGAARLDALDADVRKVVSALLATLMQSAPPTVRKRVVVRKRPEPGEPWYLRFRRSRWFWPVLGVVAGAVVAGATVGIAVGVSSGRDNRRLLLLPTRTIGTF